MNNIDLAVKILMAYEPRLPVGSANLKDKIEAMVAALIECQVVAGNSIEPVVLGSPIK
jgi:phage baseplate assembly protein W